MAPKESKRFGHKHCSSTPSFPQTQRNQEHNTIGTPFKIFQTAHLSLVLMNGSATKTPLSQ